MTATINASTTAGVVTTADTSGALNFQTNGTTALGFDSSGVLSFNSGYGSAAKAYGCRAWVNFNGTGTVAIRASGNVTSITDNGTGDYTVNFTTAMPDANYAINTTSAGAGTGQLVGLTAGASPTQTTSSVRVAFREGSSPYSFSDCAYVAVSVFR